MRIFSPPRIAALLVVALLLGIGAQQLSASAPTVKGKGKLFETFHSIVTPSESFNTDFVTVPDKQVLVITDIIASNQAGTANSFGLVCLIPLSETHNLLPAIEVPAEGTWQHSFGTGLECDAGHTLRLVPSALSGDFKITFVGYYRKGK